MTAFAGDHALNPDYDPAEREDEFRRAAVLIAVADFDGEARVLLTQRTAHLSSHSGQIAFPGGKIDGDETAVEAALREADEEVGLRGAEVLGEFGSYFSGSGYEIVPVVAVLSAPPRLTLNEDEVADAFWVPLAFLMDQSSHLIESRTFKGNERFFYAMPYDDAGTQRRIWGVTAGIIRTVQERLYGVAR
ncbi:CoA pyrophosphatase [Rhizobiaceae bacterium]|nr:CoA pyrophosphatase [Rhizobiaceae bacterium]